jgi:hypothetical protein
MVLPEPTLVAVGASVLVALVAAVMAYQGWRAFRVTANPRLPFVVAAFALFVAKSLFIAYNVQTHVVQHDTIEGVGAFFDLAIILVLFAPFVVPTAR